MEPIIVPEQGAVGLHTLRSHRVTWSYYDGPPRYKPAGWTGSDADSFASISFQPITRGDSRPSINMHPPWKPGGGTMFADYLVTLPDAQPLTLTFANAIRDSSEGEPLSDGVWFRVWASEDPSGEGAEQLFQSFTDSRTWAPGEADLRNFAGKTVLLRLESHPGPDRNTTCDSSYWAEPTIIAGATEPPEGPAFEDLAAKGEQTGKAILAGARPDASTAFLLSDGGQELAAVLQPTERGIIDGVITLVGPNSSVSFDGLTLDIMRQHAVDWPTAIGFRGYEVELRDGKAAHIHHLTLDGEPFDLTVTIWAEGPGLRIKYECPERITDVALGPADRKAPAVYYGHGYRIENPGAFRAGFGGHNLSTSHVGCDFEGGMSLLQAFDSVPNVFDVSPDARRYSLHSHMNGTLTLVPGEAGAFDCAIKYRPLYDKQPAGGVARKAGRMCFDIWGGHYADDADRMAEAIRYGLTDSFITKHVWQRWGYDYRLPDIWPPDPQFGTLEDLERLGEVCRAADIPWGLHDNYIDFYPDAEGYSYEHICFTESGQPIKAWINEGRDAQSYRWRPDAFEPFMKRNLKLIKDACAPTHYFIDVFTSASCFDFYDWEGSFHSSLETREKWGETFAGIREYLGDDAPTTSEAGHDQLTGYLDGADCQHLTLTDKPTRHMISLPCEKWERVPWFDAVNHSRFILHGVGYSTRYQGGRTRAEHGIHSDDYISAEVLTGHALMVDAGSWGRPAVRKYWLAQDIARRLALKEITSVEFVEGDMGRQLVTWGDGTRVYVNRGEAEWTVDGHVLPQYGYLVQSDGLASSIELRDGIFAESTVGPSGWYCDARTLDPDRRVKIQPAVGNFRYAGGREFSWDVTWQADEPAPRDLRGFVHFYSESGRTRDKIAFQDDHMPDTPTSQWQGDVSYSRTITVPEDAEGEYVVGFGLYDTRGRLPLYGNTTPISSSDAIWAGTVTVHRDADGIADITFTPPPPPESTTPPRLNVDKTPVDFGFAVTDGGFRVQKMDEGLTLTPLPSSPRFSSTLKLDAFALAGQTVTKVVAIAMDDTESDATFTQDGNALTIQHDGEAFAYRIEL